MDSRRRARRSRLNDEAFVEATYRELLGRPPDEEARQNALEALQRGDLGRPQLRRALLNSPEHRAYKLARSLYREMLGREPTPPERWAGVRRFLDNGLDPTPLRQQIAETMEYHLRTPPPDEEPYRAVAPPWEVWLELTTRCNMVPPCIMCGRSSPSADTTAWADMNPQVWQRLLPILRQARILGLHGGGEPLLYPHIFDLIGEIDPARTEIGFNTNGHLLTPRNCRLLIEHQVAWISVSLDAASPEMYRRLRRCDRFEQVLGNIHRLVALKKELGSRRPRLDVNMTVMCTNLPEVPRFVELAAELRADRVMFQQIKPGGDWALPAPDGYLFDYCREELSNCPDEHARAMRLAWEKAAEVGMPMEYEIVYRATGADWPEERAHSPAAEADQAPPPPDQAPPQAMCPEPWTNLLVYRDGTATFCCYHYPESPLGNVLKVPFEEVWNGPQARSIRQLVLEHWPPRCCRDCFRHPS